MKTILFFTHHIPAVNNPNGYRIGQYFPFFEAGGYTILHATTHTGIGPLVNSLHRADVVYMQRLLPGPFKRFLLAKLAKKLIFDFDDAVMFGRRGHGGNREFRFCKTVRTAQAVFCGNRFLMDQALRYRSDKVFYVPTVVDTDDYRVKSHRPSKPLIVGWMGSASTLPYLVGVLPIFAGGETGPILKVVADRPPEGECGRVIFERWSGDREKELLTSFDIGIMPSLDDNWSRGKCGLKLIQYAAAGLPAVSHPWGVALDMIEDGITGFLRPDVEAWREAIGRLNADVNLRTRMGSAARAVIETRYSLRTWGPRVVEMVSAL
jgi:glycosyltransferase involved in cell wall biosynthesis